MTKPAYPFGWPARSKDCGRASSPGDYAWNVNFHNGNANYNDHDNNGFVRAVRSGEYQGPGFRALHAAWRAARRGKRPAGDQLRFETFWIDGLLELEAALSAGAWEPSIPTCFVATRPKAREIHAPAFSDRVVHHWLVPQLEALYEPVFCFDSFSNRRGKGTHAAVDRLQTFMRQVESGHGGGWTLQLDVRNFFNSIHRATLYRLLRERMTRHGVPETLRRAVHALLRRSPLSRGARYACSAEERARVPAHKRLANAAPGCGIAIGNLSSQFFANVYLNELDQFVKHGLRARRYVRYVDDFVLVHRDRGQLLEWHARIEAFLAERLQLTLKPDAKLRPIREGVDFLGYIVKPTHRLVRRRVVGHARERLHAWGRRHVCGRQTVATPAAYREIRSIWASYLGHLSHASSARLERRLATEFPWIRSATAARVFDHRLEERSVAIQWGGHG